MAARGYFNLRNTIPGYSFILILIAFNYVPLMEILQNPGFPDFFGAFLAFFYSLSGGAIGFLISQGWWWYWQKNAGILGDREFFSTVNAFSERYGLDVPAKNDVRARRLFISAMDYADHTKLSKDHKELLTLAERRWDMFHTLSSTLLALILGLETAIIVRSYFWYINLTKKVFVITPETTALILMGISIFILIYLVNKGRIWTKQMSADLSEAIVRIEEVNGNERNGLKTAFPQLYDDYVRDG